MLHDEDDTWGTGIIFFDREECDETNKGLLLKALHNV